MLVNQSVEAEDVYQQLIQNYANIVGADNIATEWLEYCTYVGMERDPVTGEVHVYFKPPERRRFMKKRIFIKCASNEARG